MDDGTEKLSRKERERLGHQDEILAAAEVVFIRDGYHRATVEEIAREAEFSVGTLYNFFKSKGEMYARVIERIADELTAKLQSRVFSHEDPEYALSALIELRLTHFEAHRGFFRVFFESSPGSRMDPVSALPDSFKGLYENYLVEVSEIIERGITRGAFAAIDPFYQALCLEGIVNASVSYWALQETSEPLESRIARTRDTVLRYLSAAKPA